MSTWDEASIRRELKRLDEKTGLHGADLPIRFTRGKSVLGMFECTSGGAFQFSNHYFQNPEWPREEALDTIRHEYAHYMDWEIYGHCGHGSTWKMCCLQTGAMPMRCYAEERAQYYQKKHKEEEERSARLDVYHDGSIIEHPYYGTGVVRQIDGTGVRRTVVVDFRTEGRKKLGLEWVEKNCIRREDTDSGDKK